MSSSLHSSFSQANYLRIFEAWQDRLASLETLVLSSVNLLGFTGGSRKLIGSARPGGINLVIQTLPTFKTYEDILSSFTTIESLTIYLPHVVSHLSSDSPCEDVDARPSAVIFPITFIPTPRWQIDPSGESLQSNPLLSTKPTEDQESIIFIRHISEMANGGKIPVRFIDSPSYPPGFLSRAHYDSDFWDSWSKGWLDGLETWEPGDSFDGLSDDAFDGWGDIDHEVFFEDVYGGGYGSGLEEDEDLEGDDGAENDWY